MGGSFWAPGPPKLAFFESKRCQKGDTLYDICYMYLLNLIQLDRQIPKKDNVKLNIFLTI